MLEDDGKVLLGKRGERPYTGCWDIPGGVVNESENLMSALRREYREETGLEVRDAVLKDVFHYPGNGGGRAIFVLYYITSYTGKLSPTPELVDLKFFDRSELKKLDLTPWSKHFLSHQCT